MVEVRLVANQRDARKLLAFEGMLDEAVPVLQVLEALVVGDVVADQHRLRAVDVVANHLAPNRLAANVPDLQRDVHLRDNEKKNNE